MEADALLDGARLVDPEGGAAPHQVAGDGRLLVQVGGVPVVRVHDAADRAGRAGVRVVAVRIGDGDGEPVSSGWSSTRRGRSRPCTTRGRTGRCWRRGSAGNVLQMFEDRPLNYDAWDIDRYFEDKAWEVDGVESVRVTETGPVRGTVEIRRSFSRSTMVQRMHLYDSMPRIDFHTEVDWHETHTLLKAAFPVAVNASRATYEIQFGAIDRPTHRNTSWDQAQFEVCAQKWADLSEGDYGVSLLNDCKYGYDVEGNVMRHQPPALADQARPAD